MKKYIICILFVAIFSKTNNAINYDDDDDDDYDGGDYEDALLSNSTLNSSIIFTKGLVNVTRDTNAKLVKLICEVENLDRNNTRNRVVFTWFKNIQPIEKDERTFIKTNREKERTRSTLRLTNLDYFDRGYYTCVAKNRNDKIKSRAFLEINNFLNNKLLTTLQPSKAEAIFEQKKTTAMTSSSSESVIGVNHHHEFDLPMTSDGKLLHSSPEQINTTINGISEEAFCQIYNGKTCKQYLENKYVFIQPPYTQAIIEQKLSDAFLVISQSNDISSSCNKFAFPSLCYSAFPLCDDLRQINTYQIENRQHFQNNAIILKEIRNILSASLRRICRDDCLLLETELCSKEYAIAKRHPVIGQTLELEECDYLPKTAETNCLRLGIDYDENVNKDDNCYWDSGQLYRGVQDVSETGKKCLRWSHQFHIHLSEYPELTGHNYCRNPGGLEVQPFCFIDQNKKELCNLTKCAQIVGLYVIGTFLIILTFISFIICIFCCKRKSKIGRNLQNLPTVDKNIYGNPSGVGGGNASPMELNQLLTTTNHIPPLMSQHKLKTNYQNVPQYTYKEVTLLDELGEGAFGKVYKGELKMMKGHNGKLFVAVKSLKENANAKTQADFQREIELISELKHPNIICLMGVIVKQEPMCMLFEFMSEGDLHEFLIANSPQNDTSLSQNQFLHIAIQIAQGMEYLSDNHYVHRDLAARNCLVSKDLIVKISDFGLSRDMYSCDYYRVQSKSLLPVRWMPPESILYGKFTTESDVWSYGVVLWEIYSYGLQPYYGYNNQEVINMIRSRKLLPCPPDVCPSYCYALMVECWAELAIRRPSFGEITHRLKVWKQNGSNGAYFNNVPDQQQQKPHRCLNESQTSLGSKSTNSLGNKTQSTNLSNEHNNKRKTKQRHESTSLDRYPKNTIVNTNGDNFEIKISR